MRILCTADYHIANWIDVLQLKENIKAIRDDYDIVVAAGDLFEASFFTGNNPYGILKLLYPEKTVVATLGNHEFIHQKYDVVTSHLQNPNNSSDVHYLDVEGCYSVEQLNFVGNVFWYDDSMAIYSSQSEYDFTKKISSDYLFNPRGQFDTCRKQIEANYTPCKKNILVTHTCPHARLNGFLYNGEGVNAYSGSLNFLDEMNFNYSICGHTHMSVRTKINGCEAVNVGSSKEEFRYKILIAS